VGDSTAGPGAAKLQPWRDDPDHAAVFVDFDGTLAPIVADPEGARPLPGALDTLARLGQRYARVAVISGRPVRFLLDHVGQMAGVSLVGLYGMERSQHGRTVTLPEAEQWRGVIDRVAREAELRHPPQVYVERKGLSVGLHYRTSQGERSWVERFAAQQASLERLEAHAGRMSVELRPPVRADKGTVVSEMALGMRAACYLGDDWGDLPAFAALRALRAQGVATLAVVATSAEVPDELVGAADLVVDGPPGALAFLRSLGEG
jgi:trehalose 6-phosphate phosphatase